ncbi:MAG: TSCPD domain-containing protein [Desulfobacteraceae bacterium]|nr:MAG: TSCPD domain-containing protein [Desulfobacteraceae bacterium]
MYKTQGVCPPEIHFDIGQGILSDIRFVGGGCPGNALLVSRLLKGRPIDEVLLLTNGIQCRNGTSCPDQLSAAIMAARDGHLSSSTPFVLTEDPSRRNRIGLVGELGGRPGGLEKIAASMSDAGVEHIICMGNLTGPSSQNRETLKTIRRLNIQAIQGQNDWDYACGTEKKQFPPLDQQARDWLLQLPQVLIFQLGDKKCMAFFGDFIQKLPGYSDYEPYSLEMNMVCGLTDFMQEETVFPALEAMLPQFRSDVVLFGQALRWGHWRVGDKDFISVGSASGPHVSWGLLEFISGKISFRKMPVRR